MVEDLVEQGFDTVGFERNEYIGGLWRYSTDTNQMTVLKSKSLQQMPPVRHIVSMLSRHTRRNISKQQVNHGPSSLLTTPRLNMLQNAYPGFRFRMLCSSPIWPPTCSIRISYCLHLNLLSKPL